MKKNKKVLYMGSDSDDRFRLMYAGQNRGELEVDWTDMKDVRKFFYEISSHDGFDFLIKTWRAEDAINKVYKLAKEQALKGLLVKMKSKARVIYHSKKKNDHTVPMVSIYDIEDYINPPVYGCGHPFN